jgi:uncharacterized membrane protein
METRRTPSFFTPARILLVGLVVGIILCFAIPFGAGFDEEDHLTRIFDLSGLHIIPNQSAPNGTLAPSVFYDLSYQRRYYQTPASDLFSPASLNTKIDFQNMSFIKTRSIYQPWFFFPQAFVAGLFWRVLSWPVIPVVWMMRLAGLLVYLGGAYLAVRILPAGKWIMVALVLSPMALYQASTLNMDGATNAVSFVFIALILRIAASDQKVIPAQHVWWLAGATLLLGLVKQNAVFVMALLLLLIGRKFPSRKLKLVLWAAIALALFLVLAWFVISLPTSNFSSTSARSISYQIKLVIDSPIDYLSILFHGIMINLFPILLNWVASYGYWIGIVPWPVYPLYMVGLLAITLLGDRPAWLNNGKRWILLAAFIFTSAITTGMVYTAHYIPGDIDSFFLQSRYLILATPMFYLSLAGLMAVKPNLWRMALPGAMAAILLSLAFYLHGIQANYYSYCDMSFYTGQGCVQPIYKNLDTLNSPQQVLHQGTLLSQSFAAECGPLQGLEVWVRSVPTGQQGNLLLSLFDSQGNKLSDGQVNLIELRENAFYHFTFNRPVGQAGQLYEIRVTSPDEMSAAGIGLGVSPKDYYRGGVLKIDGQPVKSDLIFRYFCK